MKFSKIMAEGEALDKKFEKTLSAVSEKKRSKKEQKIVDLWMLGSTDDEKEMKGPMMSGEEVADFFAPTAKDGTMTRRFVNTATSSAIMKFYKPLRANLEMSPLEAIVTIARVLGVEKDQDGMVVIFRSLDNAAKRESLGEIRKMYPKLISAVEIEILGMDLTDLYGTKTSVIKARDKAFDKGDKKEMKKLEKQYKKAANEIKKILKKQLKHAEANGGETKEINNKLASIGVDMDIKEKAFKEGTRMRPPKDKKKKKTKEEK